MIMYHAAKLLLLLLRRHRACLQHVPARKVPHSLRWGLSVRHLPDSAHCGEPSMCSQSALCWHVHLQLGRHQHAMLLHQQKINFICCLLMFPCSLSDCFKHRSVSEHVMCGMPADLQISHHVGPARRALQQLPCQVPCLIIYQNVTACSLPRASQPFGAADSGRLGLSRADQG